MNALNLMLLFWGAASLLGVAATALIVLAERRLAEAGPAALVPSADARPLHHGQ